MMAVSPAWQGGRATAGAIPLPEDKIKQEIERILERDERRSRRGPSASVLAMRLTPERLMLAGVAALLLALIVRRFFVPLALVAVALFGLGYVLYMRRRGRGTRERPRPRPAWRGRPVRREGNVIEFRDSWQSRLRRWFRGR